MVEQLIWLFWNGKLILYAFYQRIISYVFSNIYTNIYTYSDYLKQSYFYNLALDTFEVLHFKLLNICNWYYGAYVIIYDFSRAIISPPWTKGRVHSLPSPLRGAEVVKNSTDTNTARDSTKGEEEGSREEGGRGKFALEATGSALRDERNGWEGDSWEDTHRTAITPTTLFAHLSSSKPEKPINRIPPRPYPALPPPHPRRRYFKRSGPLFSASRDVDRCVHD